RLLRQRPDDVVGLVPLGTEHRDVEGLHHLEAPPHLTRQLPGRLNGSQGTLDLELDVFGHSRAFCGVVYTTTDRLTVLCTRNGLGDLATHSLIQVGHGLEDVVNAGLDVLEAGRLIRGVTGVTEG